MKKRSKKYKNFLAKIDKTKFYLLKDAITILKENNFVKFDSSVDLAINLNLNPKQADHNIRGAVVLPHGLGKKIRVLVFAKGDKVMEANEAGADYVGGEDLAQKIQEGWMDFDKVIATPDMMGIVGKLGKILGPRGLMPNPKVGTVTFDLKKAIKETKAGKVEYKLDKGATVHCSVGKISFSVEQLCENTFSLMDTIIKVKPASAKGTYIKSVYISTTMSSSLRLESSQFKIQ